MKFLIYLILSYLVYKWFLRPLFAGPQQHDPLANKRQDPIQDNNRKQGAHKSTDDADYIDYEEIE